MKQLIIALFALLSINVSAQTLYNRVEETIAKPLEKYGIKVGRSENNYYHNRKNLSFVIPLWKTLDATTNSSVGDSTKNIAFKRLAEKNVKAYELLLQGLQQLRTSAFESYWWEKNDCDSLMISMSWNPEKGNNSYTTIFPKMPINYGADFIQVGKTHHDTSNNQYVPRCLVMFDFTYSTDSTITGTKPFNIQAYKKAVESAFKKKGIISSTFDYQYSKKYMQEHPDLYIANMDKKTPDHYVAHGDVHFIPKDMENQFIEEFKALTHAYLDSHHEEAYSFNDFSSTTELSFVLQKHIIYKADNHEAERYAKLGADSNNPFFTVWVNRLTDGRFAVIMSESYGDFRIPKEYWKYKIINDDKKVEY